MCVWVCGCVWKGHWIIVCVCGKAIGSLCVWKGQWIIVYVCVCVCVERPLDNCVCVCVCVGGCVGGCVWKGHWIIVCGKAIG